MTEEQIERVKAIKDSYNGIEEIYALLDELGISYKRTKCPKCRRDLWNILREEAGLIGSAADASDFNGKKFRYLLNRAQTWNGHLIDWDTKPEVVAEFIKHFPKGYYEVIEDTPQNEETINNEK